VAPASAYSVSRFEWDRSALVIQSASQFFGHGRQGNAGEVRGNICGKNTSYRSRDNEWIWSGIGFEIICYKTNCERPFTHPLTNEWVNVMILLLAWTTPVRRWDMFWIFLPETQSRVPNCTSPLYVRCSNEILFSKILEMACECLFRVSRERDVGRTQNSSRLFIEHRYPRT